MQLPQFTACAQPALTANSNAQWAVQMARDEARTYCCRLCFAVFMEADDADMHYGVVHNMYIFFLSCHSVHHIVLPARAPVIYMAPLLIVNVHSVDTANKPYTAWHTYPS